jgi:ATP adenylyltransferase
MDYLWTPWRYQYVSQNSNPQNCVLCEMAQGDSAKNAERLILHRARHNFIVLNIYPYTCGHCMIVPYAHAADLMTTPPDAVTEMALLARRVEHALEASYHPQGYNLGINIGRSAGAGIAGHLHLHILPRWAGDTNFMTVTAETRVLPEDLASTYKKLAPFFQS